MILLMRKKWKLEILKYYHTEEIIDEINNTPIPINNTEDKFSWNLLLVSSLLNIRLGETTLVLNLI